MIVWFVDTAVRIPVAATVTASLAIEVSRFTVNFKVNFELTCVNGLPVDVKSSVPLLDVASPVFSRLLAK